MFKNRIKLMRLVCLIYAFAWVVHVTTSFIKHYNDVINLFEPSIFSVSIFGFWIGILASLIIPGGFSLVFWSSYRTKYKDEKLFDCIPKKIIAFLLVMTIFRQTVGISIFIPALFFTLLIFIKYSEKEQLEQKADIEV